MFVAAGRTRMVRHCLAGVLTNMVFDMPAIPRRYRHAFGKPDWFVPHQSTNSRNS